MSVAEALPEVSNKTTFSASPEDREVEQPIIAFDGHFGRITVRHHRYSDAETSRSLCDNDKIWINMRNGFARPYTLDAAYSWITRTRSKESWHATGPLDAQNKEMGPLLPTSWVIALDDRLVGGLGLRFGTDVEQRRAEIGYWLGETFWGQGITTQVTRAYLDWAWENYPSIVRIEANVYLWNEPSQRVLEKLGFKHEGTKRATIFKDGKITDLLVYALIRPGVHSVGSHDLLT